MVLVHLDTQPLRPSAAYRLGVEAGHWGADPLQLTVLTELDRIHDALIERENAGALTRLARFFGSSPTPVRGLYLWGSVGRGKTFLVDLFFSHLALTAKRRLHFHRFMAEVHARMTALGEHTDPLVQVAEDLAGEMSLLCLDEFFVSDIGDAMILGRLFEQLLARGVTLVTTSNTAPENLYKDGLQRASFLPAIILLQAHCKVLEMGGGQDYRLRALSHAHVWQVPADAHAEATLGEFFKRLDHARIADEDDVLRVNDRPIAVRERADDVVWFDFSALCEGPRAVADYIEIARRFHSVILSGIPRFDRNNEDAAYRFVLLIDELYDRGVKLIASAAAQPSDLYHGQRARQAFERTVSRLIEMQSEMYLGREHMPESGAPRTPPASR
ncbi:MAG TPA: cell division protein ZapE [Chiayiivirga sp.]|nr:cell division protein ZapE [Chiayiivirga sp.]